MDVHRSPQLNLRVLQIGTERRFVLLSFAIFSTSLYMFHTELVTLFLHAPFSSCIAQSLSSPSTLTVNDLNFPCAWQPDLVLLLGLLLGEIVLLGAAFLIYWFLPNWKCWWEQLAPLEDQWPKVAAYLDALPEAYRQSLRLQYVWNASRAEFPLVFGRRGKYYLFLPYGFLNLFTTDRGRFHAIVLHELAHVSNKDAGRYYFLRAVLYAFEGVCLLPFMLFLGWSLFHLKDSFLVGSTFVASNFFLVAVFLLQVPALYFSVLRSREIYADMQAVQWAGSSAELERALDHLAPEKKRAPLLRALFNNHPSVKDRKHTIGTPESAFCLKLWEALGIGLVLGIAFPLFHDIFGMLGQLLTTWIFRVNYPAPYPDFGTLFLCLFALFIVGPMVWHATLVRRMQGQEPYGTGRFGLVLAAGLLLGFVTSPYFASFMVFYQAPDLRVVPYIIPWVLLPALGLFGFCKWLRMLAALWLDVLSTETRFRIISTISFIIAGLMLAIGTGLYLLLVLVTLGFLLPGSVNVSLLVHPLTLQPAAGLTFYWRLTIQALSIELLPDFLICFLFASLWAFPLISWFWYRKGRPIRRFHWAFADPHEQVTPYTPQNPFRLRMVALTALVGSLLFCGLLVPLRFKAGEPASAVGPGGAAVLFGPFLLPILFAPFVLSVLMQVIIAAVIALRIGPTGIINGLFGAFLSGCAMAVGTIVIFSLLGGIKPDGPRIIFLYEVTWGAACALGLVLVIGVWRSRPLLRIQWRDVLQLNPRTRLKPKFFLSISCILIIEIIVLLPVSATATARPATTIVKNGDFEEPVLLDTSAEYKAGQSFGNWTVAAGSVTLIGTRWVPAQGAQSVLLAGSTPGMIYQTLPTKSGTSYALSFALAGDPECPLPTSTRMQVLWGSTLVANVTFKISGYSQTFLKWQYYTYNVYAIGTTTDLTFIGGTPPPCGPALDAISVTPTSTAPNISTSPPTATSGATPTATATSLATPTPTATGSATSLPTATHGATPTSTSAGNATPTPTATGVTPTPTVIGVTPTPPPNPYPPGTGTLILNDPLIDNSGGYQWDETILSSGSCGFLSKVYHAQAVATGDIVCDPEAKSLFLSNFTYEVNLTIVQGSVGGIVFRFDQISNTGYLFFIDTLGGFILSAINGNSSSTIASGASPAINQGQDQSNTLAVVAAGSSIALYINDHLIAQTADNSFSRGQIGIFAAGDGQNAADVEASNAHAWAQ